MPAVTVTARQDNETLTVQFDPRRASKLRRAKRSTDVNHFDPLSELPSQVNYDDCLCSSVHSNLPDVCQLFIVLSQRAIYIARRINCCFKIWTF